MKYLEVASRSFQLATDSQRESYIGYIQEIQWTLENVFWEDSTLFYLIYDFILELSYLINPYTGFIKGQAMANLPA